MPTELGIPDTLAKAIDALSKGATSTGRRKVEADFSGPCARPITLQFDGHDYLDVPTGEEPVFLDQQVPCRQCGPCLARKKYLWEQRARRQMGMSARTWFGTITLKPEKHFEALTKARVRAREKGYDFDTLTENQKFADVHNQVSRWLTLWLKRVRRRSGAKLKYLLVAEKHKSGLVHYHVLVHQLFTDQPVTYRHLSETWEHGFTKFNLVERSEDFRDTAYYVCKYITKSSQARVRASKDYGEPQALQLPSLDIVLMSEEGGKRGETGVPPPHEEERDERKPRPTTKKERFL